jgi:tRNA-splicing ligase RtcB (3'-phosphate/5'-hydroxy nucleic acid ligase)
VYRLVNGVKVWGEPDPDSVAQAVRCAQTGDVAGVVLMADHHKGYSQPIGGVVAYRESISPSGVGYDIACGNKAVRTDLKAAMIRKELPQLMDEIYRTVSFGIGRKNPRPVDHDLFDDPTWQDVREIAPLKKLAAEQLGTVGSGNHFVDLLEEPATGDLWVAVHFGSRGFGHRTASGFLNLAAGRPFDSRAPGESMDQPPTVLRLKTPLGQAYLAAMRLAGRYAYAGRDAVIRQVLELLGARPTFEVHNHHNFAWIEQHAGEQVVVVRKGATPLAPGQLGFVGGSMADISVIVRGRETPEAREALFSTVHGAGRVMSRTAAAGKMNWKLKRRVGGRITPEMMHEAIRSYGVVLRGGGTDESPSVYRRLETVLDAHAGTLEVLHALRPIGVAMAGLDEYDPYQD